MEAITAAAEELQQKDALEEDPAEVAEEERGDEAAARRGVAPVMEAADAGAVPLLHADGAAEAEEGEEQLDVEDAMVAIPAVPAPVTLVAGVAEQQRRLLHKDSREKGSGEVPGSLKHERREVPVVTAVKATAATAGRVAAPASERAGHKMAARKARSRGSGRRL